MKNFTLTILAVIITIGVVVGGEKSKKITPAQLNLTIEKLRPLHKKLGKPQPGEWLARFKEPGQTFKQYIKNKPVTPRGKRNVIYIQPIGDFTKTQKKIVKLTAEYMSLFFNLKVKIKKTIPLSKIPGSARRVHPTWGDRQILSTYVLYKVLQPNLPNNAAAMIAFTPSDLWPGKGWNFVFGQASLRGRVGVWSIYRNGNPDKDEKSFKLCLLRTIKTAVHETGHMFSMLHCTAYECVMCGCNNREEADKHPLYLCPECLAKVCWATQTDPIERYKKLEKFCKDNGLEQQQKYFAKAIKTLEK